jgi:hypothetical protein
VRPIARKGTCLVFTDDVEALYLEMCSIFASRFGSSIGGRFRDAQCYRRLILSIWMIH